MKKYISYILIVIALVGIFSPALRVRAAEDTSYHLLAPLPCDSGSGVGAGNGPGCENGSLKSFDPAGENKIGAYLNMMIHIFIGICAVLAVVMIVIGGIEYMTTELLSGKEAGKERIRGAIFGLILALAAWTLLNQINPDILKSDLGSLTSVTVDVELDVPQVPVNGKYANGAVYGAKWDDTIGAVAQLPAGVTVNAGECATIGQTNCTSTRGLKLDYINTIKQNCTACSSLVITAGTESWLHGGQSGNTSHMAGSPTIDLRPTPELSQYISGGQTLVDGKRYTKDGISFLYEVHGGVTHWHAGP